jgi:hypothetical protein
LAQRKSSAGGHLDRKAEELLHRIEGALTPEEADAAGKAFRAWSEAEGPAAGPDHARILGSR